MTTTERSQVRRRADRGRYDTDTIHAILDAAPVGHVGFVDDGRPVVIPMLFGRDGDDIYLHGSVASRLQRSMARSLDVCLTVTLVDGLVLARSAFHHSMNYRSAVLFGRAEAVDGDEKERALRAISEHLIAGRWDEVRSPSPIELRQTAVAKLIVEEASAKIRTGGPIDDDEDLALAVWAGVLPSTPVWGEPETDALVPTGTPPSPSVTALRSAS
jgi:nitroimidazol reductase NimA-like FMN-containing flavoprotein (pyridoxamine 5'-phosphate oxidase superfamily)